MVDNIYKQLTVYLEQEANQFIEAAGNRVSGAVLQGESLLSRLRTMSSLNAMQGKDSSQTRTCLQYYDPVHEDEDNVFAFNESLVLGRPNTSEKLGLTKSKGKVEIEGEEVHSRGKNRLSCKY